MPLFFIILIRPLIWWAIYPSINSKAMLFSFEKITLKNLSIRIFYDSLRSCDFIIRKISFIFPLEWFIFTFSMLFAIDKFTLINDLSFFRLYPSLFSLTVRQIARPITFIVISKWFIRKYSLPFCLLIYECSLIIPTLCTNKSPLSTGNSLPKIANIEASIWIK